MIAKAIAAYLEEIGIEQTLICEKTGMDKRRIDCALDGTQNFSVEEYQDICKVLGVTYDFFFDKNCKKSA